MTRRPSNPSDRDRILDNATETIRYLLSPPHTIHALRDHVLERIPDGLRSAVYDGDPRRPGGETSTPTERVALDPATRAAIDDAVALDDALVAIANGVEILHRLTHRYPIFEAPKVERRRNPGKGLAPIGRCEICWAYGREEWTALGYYARFCRWCGDERTKLGGRRPPRPIWEIHQQGRRVTLAHYHRLAPDLVPLLETG